MVSIKHDCILFIVDGFFRSLYQTLIDQFSIVCSLVKFRVDSLDILKWVSMTCTGFQVNATNLHCESNGRSLLHSNWTQSTIVERSFSGCDVWTFHVSLLSSTDTQKKKLQKNKNHFAVNQRFQRRVKSNNLQTPQFLKKNCSNEYPN